MTDPTQGSQEWFEMQDLRRRRIAKSAWIPLRRAKAALSVGRFGDAGHIQEYYGDGTVALPTADSAIAASLGWGDIGINHSHEPYVEAGEPYQQSDAFKHEDAQGVHLVLEQSSVSGDSQVWHLHQDLVLALGLHREGDTWVRPNEGYEVVAKLERSDDGSPSSLSMRTEHLGDYLAARGMGLCITSYRQRRAILDDANGIRWKLDTDSETAVDDSVKGERWEGRLSAIHEGGMPYGEQFAVLTVRRTDVDASEDVPDFEDMSADSFESESSSLAHSGRKLFAVSGELWRTEWIAPPHVSPRVRGDMEPSTVTFAVDASGTRLNAESLKATRSYLWFRPEIGMALTSVRGSSVSWNTKDTGYLRCSPDHGVMFGINGNGLVNVFAKDIADLPEWLRRRWAAENATPEGGISNEMLAMQMQCKEVETVAAEQRFQCSLILADATAKKTLGIELIQQHADRKDILDRAHRLRATSRVKLLELAKDLARLTADSFNRPALLAAIKDAKADAKQLGTLKLLERVLTERVDAAKARTIMSNLVHVYDARLSDAHLPSSKAAEALKHLGCQEGVPWVLQGEMIISACADSLTEIASAFNTPDLDRGDDA